MDRRQEVDYEEQDAELGSQCFSDQAAHKTLQGKQQKAVESSRRHIKDQEDMNSG